MSIAVPLERLREAIAERGGKAYLLTVADDGRPHTVHVPLRWEGDALAAEIGARSAAYAAVRPAVTLLSPLRSDGDYSLIVDGVASVETRDSARWITIRPTKAVLHRAAADPDPPTPCGDDCVRLLPGSKNEPSL